ncbi:MAG: RHS repeat-associated core domain-containing protein, partial [Gemmatimonadales bacterium]
MRSAPIVSLFLRAIPCLVLTFSLTGTAAAQHQKPPKPPRPGPDAVSGGVTVSIAPTVIGRLHNTGPYTAVFTVKNTSTGNLTDFAMSCVAGAPITCGTVSPISRPSLAAGASFTVSVGYSVGVPGFGYARLNVAYGDVNPKTAWNQLNVKSQIATPPGVALRNHNGDNQDRTLCLTTGAGESAADVCGDLVVTHALPAFRTLGRDRSLTLVYNSRTAYHRPIVTAAVTEGGNMFAPNIVLAELQVPAGTVRRTANYNGWGGYDSTTRQIALSYDAPGYGHQTGIYPFLLRIQNQYTGQVFDATLSDTLIVVNRSTSRFGAGVWIAGLEQLVLAQPNQSLLWIGGDGSAKVYRPAGTNQWIAPKGSFQDLISFDPVAREYTRALRHGVKVVFDTVGHHIRTVTRTQQPTTFLWVADSLKSITVPPVGQPNTTYTLFYDIAGKLDRIVDPANRTLDVTVVNGQLTRIVDPDNGITSFGYNADNQLTSRTNRRGFTTQYAYANSHRVTRVTVPAGNVVADTITAVTQIQAWDEKGLAIGPTGTAVDTVDAYTKILGPRFLAGVPGDTAAIRVDRWGAPTQIVNAIGATTTMVRADAANPALATRVIYPNNRIVKLSYNARGNLSQVRDSTSHLGFIALPTKVTTYAYQDAAIPDSPTEVADSINGGAYKSLYTYTADGLTLTATDRRGHVTRFDSRASGTLRGVIDAVTEQQVETWKVGNADATDAADNQVVNFTYDARGNVIGTKSPAGVITSYQVDLIGRVTDVYDPLGLHQQWAYDPLNRITQVIKYTGKAAHPGGVQPLQTCDALQVLCVDTTTRAPAAALGTSLTSTFVPGDAGIESVTDPRLSIRRYVYDARGLLFQDIDEYDRPRTATYDRAGGATQSISRIYPSTTQTPNPHRDTVSVQYDVLGRQTTVIMSETPYSSNAGLEIVPTDTTRFTYDVMNNLLTVRNTATPSTITRSYFADGSTRSEKVTLPGGTDSAAYSYDATGSPTRAARTSAALTDVVTYAYSPTTGDLQTMAVAWGPPANVTRTISFVWDGLGRRRQITYPNNMVVKFRYDKLGLLRRLVSANPANVLNVNDRFDLTYRADSVDATGRILFQDRLCSGYAGTDGGGTGSACPTVTPGRVTTSNRFDRLGQLVWQKSSATLLHTFEFDKAGNLILRQDGTDIHYFRVAPESNRLFADSIPGQPSSAVTYFGYTANGSRLREFTPNNATGGNDSKRLYYDGLGRPSGIRDFDHDAAGRSVCMKYDAEGRLALPCDDNTLWLSYEGPNVAGTLGQRWVFIGGPGVDDPLMALYRIPNAGYKELYWLTDGAGEQLAVGMADGSLISTDRNDYLFNGGKFSGGSQNATTFGSSRLEAPNAPGFSHFRNRVYDQATGRWTQEDPVGIAGGLNLYQFNSNNPVVFADPFGLCPECRKTRQRIERTFGTTNPGILDPVAFGSGALAGRLVAAFAGAAAAGTDAATVTFFRGVSQAEALDVAETGVLRAGASASGNMGKYLTNNVEAAAQWGAQ